MTDQVPTATPFSTPEVTTVVPTTPEVAAIDLIGDDKKYKTEQAALESIPFAQAHIKNLEAQLADFKAKEENNKTMDDYLAEIKEASKPTAPAVPEVSAPQEIDYDKLGGLVDAKIEGVRKQEVFDSNILSVVNKLTEQCGSREEADKVYKIKASELALSIADMNKMAGDRPDLLLKLINVNTKLDSNSSNGGLNIDALNLDKPAEPPRKSVMSGATSNDMINAWRASAPK